MANALHEEITKKDRKTAREIANWMFREGTEQTSSGNWCFDEDEINEMFGVQLTEDCVDLIVSTLCDMFGKEILDVETYLEDDAWVIDVNFGTDYCRNLDEDDDEEEETA